MLGRKKMRLIDADKLNITEIYDENLKAHAVVLLEDIEDAPTVSAIPWNVAIRSLDTVPHERMIDRYEYSKKLKEWLMENDREFRREIEYNQWWAEHSSRFD